VEEVLEEKDSAKAIIELLTTCGGKLNELTRNVLNPKNFFLKKSQRIKVLLFLQKVRNFYHRQILLFQKWLIVIKSWKKHQLSTLGE
jgi:hypothetical protein